MLTYPRRVETPDPRPGNPNHTKRYTVVLCCGQELSCYNFTTTCPTCDADYNWNGSRLAPREQWGEETGEHWTDCY